MLEIRHLRSATKIVPLQAHRVRFRHRCSISQPAFQEAWCILDPNLGDQQLEPTVFDVFERLHVHCCCREFRIPIIFTLCIRGVLDPENTLELEGWGGSGFLWSTAYSLCKQTFFLLGFAQTVDLMFLLISAVSKANALT